MSRHRKPENDADSPFSLDEQIETGSPGLRAARIEHILFEELDRLFRLEVTDPSLSDVVPSSVQLSPDLRNAKVYYALRRAPNPRAVQDGLKRVTPFLRARLADVLVMRRLPDLHFHRDRMAESSLRASALLRASSSARSSAD